MQDRSVEQRARQLPDGPGVYWFEDASGRVLYVGKAISIRKRVRSYTRQRLQDARLLMMLEAASHIDFIVTKDEVEALILEMNLIKRHRTPFNVRLRDDKHYPYLRVTLEETFPRVLIARRRSQPGSRYFGPFTRAGAVHETLRLARRFFPQRLCSNRTFAQATRPCLNYQIKRCPAPCVGKIDKDSYRSICDDLMLFLSGRHADLAKQLGEKMEEAAESMEFEEAARLRDQLQALQEVTGSQPVVAQGGTESDVFAVARRGDEGCGQVFWIREGKLVGRETFWLTGVEGSSQPDMLTALVKQYYAQATMVPPEVIVGCELEDTTTIAAWLRQLRGKKVTVIRPQRGSRRQLLEVAQENAEFTLQSAYPVEEMQRRRVEGALSQLADYLELEEVPYRLECFDVSNLHGTDAVASMVVFEGGKPRKDQYRKYRIRTVEGADDYAMLKEAMQRRYRRLLQGERRHKNTPDLVVVDGGKGQLHAALEVFDQLGISLPVMGLAKRDEAIYLPEHSEPLRLQESDPALYLLQRLRDEAHRFAVNYHRQLRGAKSLRSRLEDVPGVGPRRRAALLRHFGSVEAVRVSEVEEIAALPGMNRQVAQVVKEYLQENK